MRVFLSYSAEDKVIAGRIKFLLERFGMEVFLAHEDIEPSSDWEDVIVEELKNCSVFIPILTENFSLSKWTDQETGFALAREIPIIPIDVGVKPYGFISKYQAFALETKDIYKSCVNIIRVILKKVTLGEEFANSLLDVFGSSHSFNEAGKNSQLVLESISLFTIQQKNKILKMASENEQIYNSYEARKNLAQFIDMCKSDLKRPLIKKLNDKMSL
jgi:hypothetical protein